MFRQTAPLTKYHLIRGTTKTWAFWNRTDKGCVTGWPIESLYVLRNYWIETSFSRPYVFVKAGSKLIVCVAVWIVENFNCYHDEFIGLSQHFGFGLSQQCYKTKTHSIHFILSLNLSEHVGLSRFSFSPKYLKTSWKIQYPLELYLNTLW